MSDRFALSAHPKRGRELDNDSKSEQVLQDLFASQRLAVLATKANGQPYSSLVAFAATDDLKQLIFATMRATRKYANLAADSRVSMLVDNRSNRPSDFRKAVAVTALGRAEEVQEPEKEHLMKIYLKKHPQLEEFVRSPSCALIKVDIEKYYMVRRFQNVMELHAKE